MAEIGQVQIKDKVDMADLDLQIEQLKHLYRLMERSSTKKELSDLQKRINRVQLLRDNLYRETKHNAVVLAHSLIKCMLMADLSSQYADEFADVYYEASRHVADKDNSFSQDLRKASDDFYELVKMINKANNLPMELYYAEMAEQLKCDVKNTIEQFCTKWFNTKEGVKYF